MIQFKRLYVLMAILLLLTAQLFAQPGIHGSPNLSGSNIEFNSYTYLTANANSGNNTISVNNSQMIGGSFSAPLTSGDLILIIQMQGATINVANSNSFGSVTNYNNAGLYEFKCVASVPNSTTIQLSTNLSNNYTSSGHVQIVRVPRFSTFNLTSGNSIQTTAWNGNTGGITAIEIAGNAQINGTISASGMGFRGGSFDNNSLGISSNVTDWYTNNDVDGANKGESIAGHEASEYQSNGYRYCRGAIANGGGGGNAHKAGGGGGANAGIVNNWNGQGNPDVSGLSYSLAWNLESTLFSASTSSGGGRGGYSNASQNRNAINLAPSNGSWGGNNRRNLGGLGGRPLDYSNGRLFLGGGGGAGDGNNNAASGGANGGGLIFIVCYGNISGTGTIEANGGNALSTNGMHNDAPGGGGGGGTIILASSGTISNTLIIKAIGGNGGDQLITTNESEGPGGGGGGGYIAISNGSPVRNVDGGTNGVTNSAALTEFTPNGATKGGAGIGNAVFSINSIAGTSFANAGTNQNFCKSVNLSANILTNASGNWSVISGNNGTFSNPTYPNTVFYGDSSQLYMLEWTVVNNLCLTKKDTILLHPICMPLPVELISFEAEYTDLQTNIIWTIAKKEKFKYFVLEKNILDNWSTLATILPESSQNGFQNFAYVDLNPGKGSIQYRLKLVDEDGSYKYSNTISIETEITTNDIIAFPIPANNTLNISGLVVKGSEIRLLNTMGQILDLPIQKEDHIFTIDISQLPEAVYFYQVLRNGQIIHSKSFIREIR